jgi:hypothetical protein
MSHRSHAQHSGQSPDLNSGSRWHRWEPHVHAPGTVLNDQFKGADSWERYLSPGDRDAGYALQFLALHRDIGRLSRLRTESLASHTDIENWRPETRARNWSDVAQNRENCASEIPQRLANSRECRGYFWKPHVVALRDQTSWLGRQDSNLGMAESKSSYFHCLTNPYSEIRSKFDGLPINGLARISEWRLPSN